MGLPELDGRDNHLTVGGLEHVLEAKDIPVQDTASSIDRTAQDFAQGTDNPGQDMTIEEAAKVLGVSEKTIFRRLKRGLIGGYKVPGQFGMEWRVKALDTPEQDFSPAQDKTSLDNGLIGELRNRIDELQSKLDARDDELQGANYRLGYLAAQLESQKEQIKLLTDSQHNAGWWQRFKSWAQGR